MQLLEIQKIEHAAKSFPFFKLSLYLSLYLSYLEPLAVSIKENTYSQTSISFRTSQISEFKFLEDRKRRLVSQLLQRKCISTALQIPWGQIRIRKTKGKKPWVLCEGVDKDDAPNFNFNVSHEVAFRREHPLAFSLHFLVLIHLHVLGLSLAHAQLYCTTGRLYSCMLCKISPLPLRVQARRRSVLFAVALQGEYVALVSEPMSICGVDVSAPQQFRGQRRSTLEEMLESLGSCFTANEVILFSSFVLAADRGV